ncbi:hypothetical protein GGR28_003078 [Lewinella aquimaris]|uniref:Beta-lactamase-inhibitor-like PepSY-like domain-containing protein n=1 Tax=Neolewinella aquimaris TaxID=1835722 RepID=A0A840E4A4_9BACT|nr:hypothetical protein [Neolewinella aquimaris]MBB4080444.1 hypothetical protein [Neolewinella aquimaris]
MLKLFTTLFFVVAVLACGNVETETDVETVDIPNNGIPAAVETAFRTAYPAATDIEWDVDDDHYEVEFKVNGDKMEVEYGFDGRLLDIED